MNEATQRLRRLGDWILNLAGQLPELAPLAALGQVSVQQKQPFSETGWCLTLNSDRVEKQTADVTGRRTLYRLMSLELHIWLSMLDEDPQAGSWPDVLSAFAARIDDQGRFPPDMGPESRVNCTGKFICRPGEGGVWEYRTGLEVRYQQILNE